MRFWHGTGSDGRGVRVSAALSSSASYAAHISVTSSYCFEYLSTANFADPIEPLEAVAARAVRRARTPSPRMNAYIRRMHAAVAGLCCPVLSCPARRRVGQGSRLSACMLCGGYRATSSTLSSPRLAASHCGYLSRISTSGAYLLHYIHACTHIYIRARVGGWVC